MYAVVLFENAKPGELDEIEVVPRSWVCGHKCYWPIHLKSSALSKAIEQCMPPDPGWETHTVEILKERDDYTKARHVCRRLESHPSTDMETTDVDSRSRRRIRPTRYTDEPEGHTQKGNGREMESDSSDCQNVEPEKKKKKKETAPTIPDVPSLPPLPSLNTDGQSTTTACTPPAKTSHLKSKGASAATNPFSPRFNTDGQTSHLKSNGASAVTNHSSPRLNTDWQSTTACTPPAKTSHVKSNSASAATNHSSPHTSSSSAMQKLYRASTESGIPEEDLPADPVKRDRLIFSTLIQIKTMVKNNGIAINKLLEQNNQNVGNESVDEFMLPISSDQDLDKIEDMLVEKKQEKILDNLHLQGQSPI